MSKANEFIKKRLEVLDSRPKIELKHPHKDQKTLYRAGKTGNLEYHWTTEFTVSGEHQGETPPQWELEPQEARELANFILKNF